MSAEALLATWARPARTAAVRHTVLMWLPLVLVASAVAWRAGGWAVAVPAALVGAAALAWQARRIARRYDRRWLTRRLDARRGELEDSAELLFAPLAGPLAALQRARVVARLEEIAPAALREERAWRPVAAAWLAALVAVATILLWPERVATPPPLSPASEGSIAAGAPRLTGQRLRIVPPAYTGLPPRWAGSLDARVPAGSRIDWTLAFAPAPAAAALELLGGQRVTLARGGGEWTASLRLDRSLLYRVRQAGGAGAPPLHRLEAITDTPPQVRAVTPEEGLVLMRAGQRSWRVVFEARDDYGVAPSAPLRLTIAQGEGENVTFSERAMTLRGSGPARQRRFAVDLNLATLGFRPGGDLVVQLTVADQRAPAPQQVRGPAVILRWPSTLDAPQSGLELMTQRILPAYFRSQRQIIIDAEALIPRRPRLSADRFMTTSDEIGVDQRLLRLRYGQFLGEEAEGGPKPPVLPTNDAPNEPEAHSADDGHDHGAEASTSAPPVFGQEGDVIAEFGHTHDEREAATLLDPDTRATLRQALDQMWQSELNLRQGKPEAALPYAYKALAFIKQVQQATRIFLARVGPQLPPLDLSRRMSGKRDGLGDRAAPLTPIPPGEVVPAAAWRALGSGGGVDLNLVDRWVRENEARVRDPLSLLAALDGVRASPGCSACRERLRAQLWSVLSRPPAGARRRGDGGPLGRRYLNGLR